MAVKKDPRLARAGVSGFNKPKRTPSHAKKSHVVVAKEGDKVKTIRFGEQGAISNGNAALAGRRARFQGIGLFKASGGKVGGRKHTVSATNLREFGHRSRRDPPEASMFVLRRRGFSTRKLSSDPCDTTHPTTPWATQPQPSQPESEETQKADTGRIWCHLRGKPSTMVSPKARLGPGAHTQKTTAQGAQATARGAPGCCSSAGEKDAGPAPGCHFQ